MGAQAAVDAKAQQEITQLLDFVEHSGCQFIRNGSEYPAAEARAHLQKKLNYLENKDMVSSAEDFIERAATKSSMSGQRYQVDCPAGKQDSSTWLTNELKRLRQAPQGN
jgi:cell division septum initiation protein DivIVA